MRQSSALESLFRYLVDTTHSLLSNASAGVSYVVDVECLYRDLTHLLEFFHQLVSNARNARVICSISTL